MTAFEPETEIADSRFRSNTLLRTFPDGLDVEVMRSSALEDAAAHASDAAERQLAYWQRTLDGAPRSSSFLADRPRGAVQSVRGTAQRNKLFGHGANLLIVLLAVQRRLYDRS